MLERTPQRRRDRPRPSADFGHATVRVVSHDHAGRITRQALRRFRRNARTTLEDRLTRLIGVREHRRVRLLLDAAIQDESRPGQVDGVRGLVGIGVDNPHCEPGLVLG